MRINRYKAPIYTHERLNLPECKIVFYSKICTLQQILSLCSIEEVSCQHIQIL